MTEHYEHMRAMRRMHRQRTQEMELMIGSGMYGWMQAWARYARPLLAANTGALRCDTDASGLRPSIPDVANGQAVGIYTAMVWDIVKEEVHAYAG
jgi:hypothetical protein